MFVNCFGLGTVGGDFARALVHWKRTKTENNFPRFCFCRSRSRLDDFSQYRVGIHGNFRPPAYRRRRSTATATVRDRHRAAAGISDRVVALAFLPKQGVLHKKMQEIAGVFPRDLGTIGTFQSSRSYFICFKYLSTRSWLRVLASISPGMCFGSYHPRGKYFQYFTEQLERSGTCVTMAMFSFSLRSFSLANRPSRLALCGSLP